MAGTPEKRIFLSCVSREFRSSRDILAADLRRAGAVVKVQEDFAVGPATLLESLDDYIRQCDAVLHIIGDATGSLPKRPEVDAILARHKDLGEKIPPIAPLLALAEPGISYTQWEAWLAIYHRRDVHFYEPAPKCPRDRGYVEDATELASQRAHYERIRSLGRHRGQFENAERLSSHVLADLHSAAIIALPEKSAPLPPGYQHPKVDERLTSAFIGRTTELSFLHSLWADVLAGKPGRPRVAAFIAPGGVGKTALIARFIEELRRDQRLDGATLYEWSFYSQGVREQGSPSSDAFFTKALADFPDPAPLAPNAPAWEKGQRLARLLARSRTLLVLDGLEPLQHPPGPNAARLRDQGIAGLLAGLRRENAGLCLITSREPVVDLRAVEPRALAASPGAPVQWDLGTLHPEDGARLLHRLGANRAGRHPIGETDPELLAAAAAVRGHALALTLLGTWLAEFQQGDIRQRDKIRFSTADGEIQGGHAFKILHAYETWLDDGSKEPLTGPGKSTAGSGDKRGFTRGQRMLAMLRLLGFFDRAVEPALLAVLLKGPALEGITEPLVDAGPEQWRAAIADLEKLRLVGTQPPRARGVVRGYGEEKARARMRAWRQEQLLDIGQPEDFRPERVAGEDGLPALDAHPLLREYFARQLAGAPEDAGGKLPDGFTKGHGRLADHLLQSVPYWPEGEEGLQPLYQAIVHGTRAGRVQEMCDGVYHARTCRGAEFYSQRKLGLHSSDLGAVGCFFAKQWQAPSPELRPDDQAWLLNEAAQRLRAVGRLAEAVEPLQLSLEMCEQQNNRKEAAIRANNLSELELAVGAITDARGPDTGAVCDGARSVELADRSGDEFLRIVGRTTHADALHHAGERDAARALFAEAETLQEKWQPGYPLLSSLWGYRYCDLLLADAEQAAWRAQLAAAPVPPASPEVAPESTKETGRVGVPPAVPGILPGTSNAGQTPPSEHPFPHEDERAPNPHSTPPDSGSVPRDAGHGRRDAHPTRFDLLSEIAARATRTLGWATQHLGPRDIALDHLTLARVALYGEVLGGTPAGATVTPADATHFQSALAHIRADGTQEFIPRVLLPCAWWRVRRGETAEARALLDEAEEISRRGGMKLLLTDTLLHRALLFPRADAPGAQPGDPEAARQALEEATHLIAECHYKRREPELAMLRQALGPGELGTRKEAGSAIILNPRMG